MTMRNSMSSRSKVSEEDSRSDTITIGSKASNHTKDQDNDNNQESDSIHLKEEQPKCCINQHAHLLFECVIVIVVVFLIYGAVISIYSRESNGGWFISCSRS